MGSSVGTGGAQSGGAGGPPRFALSLPHRAHIPARRPGVPAGWSPEGPGPVEYGGVPRDGPEKARRGGLSRRESRSSSRRGGGGLPPRLGSEGHERRRTPGTPPTAVGP